MNTHTDPSMVSNNDKISKRDECIVNAIIFIIFVICGTGNLITIILTELWCIDTFLCILFDILMSILLAIIQTIILVVLFAIIGYFVMSCAGKKFEELGTNKNELNEQNQQTTSDERDAEESQL